MIDVSVAALPVATPALDPPPRVSSGDGDGVDSCRVGRSGVGDGDVIGFDAEEDDDEENRLVNRRNSGGLGAAGCTRHADVQKSGSVAPLGRKGSG